MERLVGYIARVIRAGRRAYARKTLFSALFILVFFAQTSLLRQMDLLPSRALTPSAGAEVNSATPTIPELPRAITIPAIGLSASIANPTAADPAILDRALLKGAVRYPTSARLGEAGNVVLFGHSSYLPIVGNQAYKTFNGIQKLKAGDIIIVSSSNVAYTYKVRGVRKEDTSDGAIPLSVAGRELTLSTCDSFSTTKTSRFVVVADFVESRAISG